MSQWSRYNKANLDNFDWSLVVHPTLRVSNQEGVKESREPLLLSGGCLLYRLDGYRQSVIR
jgi:hypothetical protein